MNASSHRPLSLLMAATGLLWGLALPASAAETKEAKKPAGAATTAKAAKPKPVTPRQQLRNQAQGLALATTTVEQITAGQLDAAARVLTGTAECEFRQQVHLQAVDGKPGHFHLGWQSRRYTMVPQETQTGAVRLEDKHAGIVWLQIPTKSMLMDTRRGQRLVDGCTQSEQRAAVAAAEAAPAPSALGISATPASAPAR